MSDCNGHLSCAGNRWPVCVSFGPTVMRSRHDRHPCATDPQDQALTGKATVSSIEGVGLPTDGDLLSRADVFLLVETLPIHGGCPSGEWQLPVVVINPQRDEEGQTLSFGFTQHGTVGRTLD